MKEVIRVEGDWFVSQAAFSPAETEAITKLPQPMLRLWRSRGYLAQTEKGRWSRHVAEEVALVYLLQSLTKMGLPPSEAAGKAAEIVPDLLFFALVSGDGACDFAGPRDAVEAMRHRFDDDFALARQIAKPTCEDRFVVSEGSLEIWRCADLSSIIEQERLEIHNCLDLLVAGRRIVERAGRPFFSFVHEGTSADGSRIRRLSHGR